MFDALVKSSIQRILKHFGYDLVYHGHVPHGNLAAFCANISARGFYPRRILDVGANKGDWSREVKTVFPNALFTLIEPQIEMRMFLNRFCAETKGSRWINAGAGAFEGELRLTVCADTVSSSFLVTDEEAIGSRLPQRLVRVITLDSVCRDVLAAIPEIVKLDVEGFEHEVLKGSQTLLGKTELFLLELTFFSPRTNAKTFYEMIAIMADYGYFIYDFTCFERRPYDNALGLCEAVFARDRGYLRSYMEWS
jgi:FkbM family methyltransferase